MQTQKYTISQSMHPCRHT